ncbi:MAG TPA: DUF2203 domain-containing protein [Actinomycetota bacterium]|nr:DUF2203 domain-containing protein [Actinomycetota bacterium]
MTERTGRVYTPEEADATLPELRALLERVRANRQVILREVERIKATVARDGGGHGGKGYWEASAALKADVQSLAERDILLRDPETGLVDFPAERDGRPIFLCWRMGEERVGHWHEIHSGFVGRQPL